MSNSFNIIGLDFDEAKASLRTFLQSQNTLKDYNFDGSVLSTLLDVLAYNTHYQAFYTNMVANEMFLDSAVLRPSVVSHAKAIGYLPSSRRASKAILTIVATGSTNTTYLSRGTEFVGTDPAGTQHRFILLDTVYANGSTQKFENIEIYEGTLRRMSYVFDGTKKAGSILVIPNDKIDISTIKVRVKASASDNTGMEDVWSYADSYIDLTADSKVYFLQEKETGMYELFFGDNFLGKTPTPGSVVIVEYLETSADEANGIDAFTASVTGLGTITVNSISSGGSLEESVASIKFLAPRFYKSQSRAVTEDDYTSAVMKEYPNTDSVYVYGGETVVPPQYGKVFIALKPKSGSALTTSEKINLANTLKKNRSVVSITPEIVDPDYIDLVLDCLVTYDPSLTSVNVGTLKALIVAYLFIYSSSTLETFGSNFYASKISNGIDQLNSGILGNQITVKLRKTVNLSKLVASKGITIDFKNPLYHPHEGHISVITSTIISHKNNDGVIVNNVYVADDGYGKLNLITITSEGMQSIVYTNIGTIDYMQGTLKFNTSFSPVSSGSLFTITVEPAHSDIFVFENKIIRLSRGYSDSVTISMKTQMDRKQTLKM